MTSVGLEAPARGVGPAGRGPDSVPAADGAEADGAEADGTRPTGPRWPRYTGACGSRFGLAGLAALPRHPGGVPQNGEADRHAVLAEKAFLAVRAATLTAEAGTRGRIRQGQDDQVVRRAADRGDDLIADRLHAGHGLQVTGAALERALPCCRPQSSLGHARPGHSCHAAIEQQPADNFENGRAVKPIPRSIILVRHRIHGRYARYRQNIATLIRGKPPRSPRGGGGEGAQTRLVSSPDRI